MHVGASVWTDHHNITVVVVVVVAAAAAAAATTTTTTTTFCFCLTGLPFLHLHQIRPGIKGRTLSALLMRQVVPMPFLSPKQHRQTLKNRKTAGEKREDES